MASRVTQLFLCLLVLFSSGSVPGQIFLGDFSANAPLKIMPVGDSITDDCEVNGAWRARLQADLQANGFPFVFVGRQSSIPDGAFTQVNHEGYCGAVVAYPGVFAAHQYSAANNYLQKIVPDALAVAANTPNVMLILIGANDIGRGRDPYQVATNDVATLLSLIYSNAPNVCVGLAKITSLQNGNVGGLLYGNYATNVPVYNALLQKLVNQRRATGQKIFLADMYSVVDYGTMFNSDHVHPNGLGLALIGDEWLAQLKTITVQSNLVTTVLIHGGADWKYNDTGQDMGTNWMLPGYDDSAWGNGIARLGYGDSVAATTVSFGPQITNKYVTTYFRHPFVVPPDAVITNLNFRVAESDGAVIYLNGREVYRVNMPPGPITYTNLALTNVSYFSRYIFYPTNIAMALPPGTNWIAAEVHLSAATNSTMGFDMELIGSGHPGPQIGSLQLLAPSLANENGGTLAAAGNVSVSVAPTNDLIVNLTSSDITAATVPPSVVIPAGQTNATFDITLIDNHIVGGSKAVFINASASFYGYTLTPITVTNNDQRSLLYLSIPASANKNDGTLVGQGQVVATPIPTNNLTVNLTSSLTSRVTVPPTVTISAGQSNAVFNLTIINDNLLTGDQQATITATALNYTNTQATITVHDTNTATLSVTLPASAVQSAGTLTNAGLVSIGTTVAANIPVYLRSSDPSKLIVPATTVLSNGQSSAMFNLTLVSNNIIEGPQTVTVTANVTNWTAGSASMTIVDDNPLPNHFTWNVIPSPQWVGEPIPVTITAQDAAGNTLDYRLGVTLDAWSPGTAPGTNTILNSPVPNQSENDGPVEYVLGYAFTPSTNLTVTHARHYFGDKVSLWTSGGQLLESANYSAVPGTWTDTALANPVVLAAGNTYFLTVHATNATYYWNSALPASFTDGTIDFSCWDYGDVFPTQTDSAQWYSVDLRYSRGVSPVLIGPQVTGDFTNGIWSGTITVLQAVSNVTLQATAGAGSSGVSLPFSVLGAPKLAITALNNSVVLSWPVVATNFNLEQASTLGHWSVVPGTPTAVGDWYYVTNAIGTTNTYYRLHKP